MNKVCVNSIHENDNATHAIFQQASQTLMNNVLAMNYSTGTHCWQKS